MRITREKAQASPLLLAIDSRKYRDHINKGLEATEYEIRTGIDFQDIHIIDSIEKIRNFWLGKNPDKFVRKMKSIFDEYYQTHK